jgi:hypothetical protein
MKRSVKAWVVLSEKNSESIGNIIMITRKRETAIARTRWNKNCNYPYGKIVSCTITFDDKKVKK